MHRKSLPWITLILLVALAATSRAQTGGAPGAVRVTFGPFVGMNYTTVHGADAEGANSRWDFAFGGQLDAGFGGAGMFRTGLLYSGRGTKTTEQGVDLTAKIRYLEIPLLLGYKFPTTGARPYFAGGAQVGFKVSCKLEASFGGQSESTDCDDPQVGGDFASTDVAIVGGGGVLVPFGTNELTLDLRYAYGLSKIEKSTDIKNAGFTFGVGIMIPIGR